MKKCVGVTASNSEGLGRSSRDGARRGSRPRPWMLCQEGSRGGAGVGVGWGVGRGSKSAVILLEGVLFCL